MRSSILLVSGLAAAQAFCPAPAASGVLSLRAQADSVSRRNVLAGVLGGASVAALNIFAPAEADAASARTGPTSPFTGEYDDPNHPGCERSVKVTGQTLGPDGRRRREPQVIIRGTDSSTGTCTPGDAEVKPWRLTGYVTEKGDKMFVDFSPKGGPKDLVATYEGGIKFPDGNTWTRKEPVAAK